MHVTIRYYATHNEKMRVQIETIRMSTVALVPSDATRSRNGNDCDGTENDYENDYGTETDSGSSMINMILVFQTRSASEYFSSIYN